MAITIGRTLSAGMAPLLVSVDASAVTGLSDDVKKCRVVWDFNDPAAPTNKQKGHCAGHVYEREGTYQITCTVTDPAGTVQVAQLQVDVAAFAGTTFYVAEYGDDASPGTSETAPLRTLARAIELAQALFVPYVATPVQILLARGQEFRVEQGFDFGASVVGKFTIGSYGPRKEERPIVHYFDKDATEPLFRCSGGLVDFSLVDLDLRGAWSGVNGEGPLVAACDFAATAHASLPARLNRLYLRCHFTGWHRVILESYSGAAALDLCNNVGLVELTATRTQEATVEIGGKHVTVYGCNFAGSALGHVLRAWWLDRSSVAHSSMLEPGAGKSALAINNATAGAKQTSHVSVRRDMLRGGAVVLDVAPTALDQDERIDHVSIDRCDLEADSTTLAYVHLVARDVTARVCAVFGGAPMTGSAVFHVEEYSAVTGFAPQGIAVLWCGAVHEGVAAVFARFTAPNLAATEFRGNLFISQQAGEGSRFYILNGATPPNAIDDSWNASWRGGDTPYYATIAGVAKSLPEWAALDPDGPGPMLHGFEAMDGGTLGVIDAPRDDLRPWDWSPHREGAAPDPRVYEDNHGDVRVKTAPSWSYGPIEAAPQIAPAEGAPGPAQGSPAGGIEMQTEWATPLDLGVREASMNLGGALINAEQAESLVATVVGDAALQIAQNSIVMRVGADDVPALVTEVLGDDGTEDARMSFPGPVVVKAGAAPAKSAAGVIGDARLGLIQQALRVNLADRPAAATGFWSPDGIGTDARLVLSPVGFAMRAETAAIATGALGDARLLLTAQVPVSKGDISRSWRSVLPVRKLKAPGDQLWAGMALGMKDGIVRFWRPGDIFGGFAAERAGPPRDALQVYEQGVAQMDIAGVTGPGNYGAPVYLASDAAFTLSPGTPRLGKVIRWITGRRCEVWFASTIIQGV